MVRFNLLIFYVFWIYLNSTSVARIVEINESLYLWSNGPHQTKSGSIRTSIGGPRFVLFRQPLQTDIFHQTNRSSFNQYLIENGTELNTKNTFKITELNILISVSVNWILNELQFLSFLPILRVRFSTFSYKKLLLTIPFNLRVSSKIKISPILTVIRENSVFEREWRWTRWVTLIFFYWLITDSGFIFFIQPSNPPEYPLFTNDIRICQKLNRQEIIQHATTLVSCINWRWHLSRCRHHVINFLASFVTTVYKWTQLRVHDYLESYISSQK